MTLLPASAKRHRATLGQAATVVPAGRWLDAWLLVAPSLGPAPAVPTGALAATLAVLAGIGLIAARRWRSVTSRTMAADGVRAS